MLSPDFLRGPNGNLFIQQFLPETDSACDRAVLLVPPFAEELNKSRRMLALLGRGLAADGIPVLLPDLHGTGDSAGDFRDADWDIWHSNLTTCAQRLMAQGVRRIVLVGLRMGCLLAADWIGDAALPVERLVFWQPVLSGQQLVNQFLRLRLAASVMSGQQRETIADLRRLLEQHGVVEVAGYEVSNSLIESLDRLALADLLTNCAVPVHWFEVQAKTGQALPLPVQKLRQQCSDAGLELHLESLISEAFWATLEISEIPELVERTRQVLVMHHA